MNEDIIRAAGTAIHDLMAQLEATRLERDQYKRERDEARALLARYSTSLNEKSNDPASDGKPEAKDA